MSLANAVVISQQAIIELLDDCACETDSGVILRQNDCACEK